MTGKTNVAQVRFLVEEEAGRCFVRLQQQHVPGIPLLRYGSLRFDLADGVTRQEAEELADVPIEKCIPLCMRARTSPKSGRLPKLERAAPILLGMHDCSPTRHRAHW